MLCRRELWLITFNTLRETDGTRVRGTTATVNTNGKRTVKGHLGAAQADCSMSSVPVVRSDVAVMSLLRRSSSNFESAMEARPVMKGKTLAVACGAVSLAVAVAVVRRWQRKSIHALPRRRLGKTGLHVTVVSLGGVGLGGKADDELYGGITDEAAIATVHRAIARGINFIDTSPLYRESERRIGLALEALSEVERARIHVGTKVGDDCPPFSDNGGHSPFSYDGVMCSIRHSLKQLRVVKRLATVLLHDPTLAELDEFVAPGGGLEALCELQSQGVV
eukprot:4090429-Prymnesium_polylepis.1